MKIKLSIGRKKSKAHSLCNVKLFSLVILLTWSCSSLFANSYPGKDLRIKQLSKISLHPNTDIRLKIPLKSKTEEITKIRVAVIGLVHTHVHWILGRKDQGDIEVVGIVETNRELAKRFSLQHGFSMDLVYSNMSEMVEQTKPEAVVAFNSIYDHLEVVEFCAPKGIHVMVEKPMAVNLDHAKKMVDLARKYKIHLLTNYETSWYGSTKAAYERIIEKGSIGQIRKIIFNTGHPGPIEIGCNIEFLDWLTDPIFNGGGALTDFGCYGANMATWLMEGKTPNSVFCMTQQIKPEMYPKVEDDATIILTYAASQVIIQASWNWSHNRKDMEVYGQSGYVQCHNGQDMTIMEDESTGPFSIVADPPEQGLHDPFAYLSKIVQNNHSVPAYGLSSLENNLIVMQILEAAKESAKTKKIVFWKDMFE